MTTRRTPAQIIADEFTRRAESSDEPTSRTMNLWAAGGAAEMTDLVATAQAEEWKAAVAEAAERDEVLISPEAGDAVDTALYHWENYIRATTLPAQADAFIALSNAMHDVATWHPLYDADRGEVVRPED